MEGKQRWGRPGSGQCSQTHTGQHQRATDLAMNFHMENLDPEACAESSSITLWSLAAMAQIPTPSLRTNAGLASFCLVFCHL